MDQKKPLGAQISHMLQARGVEVIFGIPGVHNIEMYRGIEEAGITHVLARHEQGAGFMADGFARATGRPGVAYVITGPGLCNIMTPMGQAYSDSVPMLVLSSCLDETAARKGQLHQMKDQQAAAATVCDWSHTAQTAQAAYQLIDRALLEFETDRPRPKHIQVPIALLGAAVKPAGAAPVATGRARCSREFVAQVGEAIAQARRVLFVFGGGLAADRAAPVNALLQACGAAAFTSYAGRGIVAAEYPLLFGAGMAHPASAEVFASADLVVAVATELAEVDIWRDQLGYDCPLVRVDIDPESLTSEPGAVLTGCGDAGLFVADLLATLGETTSDWQAAEVATCKRQWRAESDAARAGICAFAQAMQAALPDETRYYSDMTQFAYVAKDVLDMPAPNLWHHPFGFGTLGYALPAAIGGKIGVGDAPVVAIMGDYGFHYTMQELGVAVELGLSLPIILWDNGKLGEIEASMIRSQIAPNAVIAQNPDFCALARAFGAHAVQPASVAAFQAALSAALTADGPTLIHLTPDCAA